MSRACKDRAALTKVLRRLQAGLQVAQQRKEGHLEVLLQPGEPLKQGPRVVKAERQAGNRNPARRLPQLRDLGRALRLEAC